MRLRVVSEPPLKSFYVSSSSPERPISSLLPSVYPKQSIYFPLSVSLRPPRFLPKCQREGGSSPDTPRLSPSRLRAYSRGFDALFSVSLFDTSPTLSAAVTRHSLRRHNCELKKIPRNFLAISLSFTAGSAMPEC